MQDLFDVINGAPVPAGVTRVSLTEYSFDLDLELDGTTDITVDVDIILPGGVDISDGMVDEWFTVSLTFQGTIFGSGTPRFEHITAIPPILFLSGPISLDDGGTCRFDAADISTVWVPGNLESANTNFFFEAIEGISTYTAQIFGDSDFLTAFGQLVVGAQAPVDAGFVIDLDTFEVFED